MDRIVLIEVIGSVIMQAVLIGIFVGWIKTSIAAMMKEIQRLEAKQDKHNDLIERMVVVEQRTASAHKRLDEIKFEINTLEENKR